MALMRVRIEYFDQNERFAKILPIEGIVISCPICNENKLKWYLVELDTKIKWENIEYKNILIASRWEDSSIESDPNNSVYILLVKSPDDLKENESCFSYKNYISVAWGTAIVAL